MVPAIIGAMLTGWFASDMILVIRTHRDGCFQGVYLVWANVAVVVGRIQLGSAQPDDHVSGSLIVANPLYALILGDIATLKMLQRGAAVTKLWARLFHP
jgi:hypothetical protein